MRPPYSITTFEHADVALDPLASLTGLRTFVDVALGKVARAPYPFPPASDLYMETHIFGDIDLARDVTAIVIGPKTAGTPQAARLVALGKRLGILVHVNPPNGVADVGFLPA